jgi:hypothetical protein
MSCCGSKRQQQFPLPPRPVASNSGVSSIPTGVPGAARQTAAVFVYEGQTALTVTGRVTRRSYRFPHTGARIAVDVRDVPGLRGVAMLRRA